MKARWALEASGLSLLVLLPFFDQLLFPGSTILLHERLALSNPIGGILIDLVVFAGIGLCALYLASRLGPFTRQLAEGCLVGFVLWASLFCAVSILILIPTATQEGVDHALSGPPPFLLHLHSIISRVSISFPMLFTAFAVVLPRIVHKLARVLRYGIAAFGFCAIWIVPELFYLAFGLHPVHSFDHSAQVASSSSSQRIVWVLFDELSYDLAFEHQPAGEQFPRLQKLHSQSISLANVRPLAFKTEQIIPSLLAGRELEDIRSKSTGSMLYLDPVRHQWLNYDPTATLFGMAHAQGWNPGVVGWYNAYCRIFVNVLTACTWRPGIQEQIPLDRIGASRNISVAANSLVVPRYLFDLFFWHLEDNRSEILNENLADYQELMASSRLLLQNDRIHFVFLHLPVPHPPGLYNRTTHQLCACGNYIDNLALADVTLGQLLDQVDRMPDRDRTTVIVSSDHSWRVPLWNQTEFWTPEEAQVSQGRFDERPVFMVHFPGQTTGSSVPQAMPELVEHDLIASMLEGKVNSPDTFDAALQKAATGTH